MAKDVPPRRQPGRWLRSSHPFKECVTAHWPSRGAPTIHGAKHGAEAAGWRPQGPIGRGASRTAAKRHRRGAVERPGERMLARVARWGRETPTPNARGLLGKARPPRVSRGLRGGRRAYPKGRQADIPAPRGRVTSDAVTRARAGAGFWTSRSPNARREGPNDLARSRAEGGTERGNPEPERAQKSRWPAAARPYRRPTQVGRQSMPRRTGQPWSRNSAKSPRNLGRRGARGRPRAAVERPRRLFTKNTGLCSSREATHRV